MRASQHISFLLSASARYDLVFEDEDGFHRVQCKTGRFLATWSSS
ncbi:MAG: group I intron-associated PD-(D/E)XK endonuclease [Egibacteraceae bacterium]